MRPHTVREAVAKTFCKILEERNPGTRYSPMQEKRP